MIFFLFLFTYFIIFLFCTLLFWNQHKNSCSRQCSQTSKPLCGLNKYLSTPSVATESNSSIWLDIVLTLYFSACSKFNTKMLKSIKLLFLVLYFLICFSLTWLQFKVSLQYSFKWCHILYEDYANRISVYKQLVTGAHHLLRVNHH